MAEFKVGVGGVHHGQAFDQAGVAARWATSPATLPHTFILKGIATAEGNNMNLRMKRAMNPPIAPERRWAS
jgi:hypothetical protein